MLESEGIVFIRLKLSPVTLWEPTHFIPKYPALLTAGPFHSCGGWKRCQLQRAHEGLMVRGRAS